MNFIIKSSFCRLTLLLSFLLLLSFNQAHSQFRLDNWKTYTSYVNVRETAVDSFGRAWAGSSGGVFVYNPDTGESHTFNNINGLLGLDISAISYNPADNKVYAGSFNGNFDIADSDFNWENYTEIKNSSYPDKKINDIIFYDDKAFIATAFGITVFDIHEKVFIETIVKIGEFDANTAVNELLITGSEIWAATEEGAAKADLNSLLAIPANWVNFTESGGLPEKGVVSLTEAGGKVYAANINHISIFENGSFTEVKALLDWEQINALFAINGEVHYATPFYVKSLSGQSLYSDFELKLNNASVSAKAGGEIMLSFEGEGAGILNEGEVGFILPDSPISNNFQSMGVDGNGNLWVATGDDKTGRGLMKFDGSRWINLTKNNTEGLDVNSFWALRANGGKVCAATWGAGLYVFDAETHEFQIYDETNTPLVTTVIAQPSFIIPAEAVTDNRGATWIVNYGQSTPGPILVALTDEGNYSWENPRNATKRFFKGIVIDNNGTKWVGSNLSDGLYYLNERNTFSDYEDDLEGVLTTSNSGLPDNGPSSLALDQNGLLWVGTSSGLRYIANTSGIFTGSQIIVREPAPRILRGEAINALLVDAINNLWVATNNGVFVLSPEQELIGEVNVRNSPILSNKIISLAHNPLNGSIFIGTEKGLSEAVSLSVQPLKDFDISVYPQPFNPGRDEELVIEGLAPDALLKITTIDGKLIRTISATGKVAVWNGRDENGNYVSTGVYLILAASESTEAASVGKAAVIRDK